MRRDLAPVAVGLVLLLLLWYVRDAHLRRKAEPSPIPGITLPSPGPHEQRRPSRDIGAPPAGTKGSTAEQIPEGGDRADRLIASMDWAGYGGALLAYIRIDEERRDGKPAEDDPETIETLARGNAVLDQLAELLGIRDSREILLHEKIAPNYARGTMGALRIMLTPAQERGLDDQTRAWCRSRAEGLSAVKDANRLERLAWESEQSLLRDQGIQKVLTADQFAQYTKPAGTDAFWGRQAGRRNIPAAEVDVAEKMVADFWAESFGLDEASRDSLRGAASRFVREWNLLTQALGTKFPSGAPREEQVRMQISLLRQQALIERDLGRTSTFTPQQKLAIEQGSGKVLRLIRE